LGDSSDIFCYHFGVQPQGNAPPGTDPHGEFTAKNILIQRQEIAETAAKFGIYADQVKSILTSAKKILFEVREKRPHPFFR